MINTCTKLTENEAAPAHTGSGGERRKSLSEPGFSLPLFSSLLPCFCLAFEKRREEIYGMQRIHRQAAGLTVDATNAPGFVLPCTPAKAQSPTTAHPPHCSLQRNAVNFSRFSTALNFLLLFVSRQKEGTNTPPGKHNKNKPDLAGKFVSAPGRPNEMMNDE